ncbi:Lrp/AsnC family transcriptional regulator [Albimonas sp. CAU 1670]|uniref:Lrp/AsnC family transcriptional regulator n=1 Tax=Albimonas sp. CAU 1670 TaxID=3032599 RepID=UPI0023DC1CA0|nr:Lrp/AsnC family transcriptional regulator [Albimonas sp. CAU 1670]MDF2232788.1 Lrp/AsnC family transcriptional regulator [Albimonas sp. CAU 1670]
MTESIDDTDRALLGLLARNARSPATELARKLNLARTTVQARIEKLERAGVIRGYTVRTETAPGAMIRAYVLVQVEPRYAGPVAATISRMKEVESLHTTSGRFDLAAQVGAPDTAQLDAALDRIAMIEGVRGIETLVQLTTKVDRRW